MMSEESGGGCCCKCRSKNKVVPVLTGEISHRTIEVRQGRYICVHYFNPYPRDEKFQQQMKDFIDKNHTDRKHNLIPKFKKRRESKKENGPHFKEVLKNDCKNTQTIGKAGEQLNTLPEVKHVDCQVINEVSSAKMRPDILSPSELTILSLKSEKATDNSALCNTEFNPIPDCTSDIKYPNQTIFLLHGVGGSADIWTGQSQYFADLGYEVIVPEWIGHGFCPGSNDPRDFYFSEIVKDLTIIFDLHCKRSNVIIGHSYGACFAAVLARTRPRLVQSLVMISGGAPTPLAPQTNLFKVPTCLLVCLSPLLRYCLMQRAFYKTARDSGEHKRAFEVSTSVIQNTMNGQYWPEGDTEYHHGISCPTLLIHGSEDQLISVEEELEMKEAIFGSLLHIVEEASHMVMMEKPVVVNSYIRQLISGIGVQTQEPLQSAQDFGSTESMETHSHPVISPPNQRTYPNKLLVKLDSPASQRKSARSIPSRIFSAKKRS